MSTGFENEHTTPPPPPLSNTSDVTQQVLFLLSGADDKCLREIRCHCRIVLDSQKIADSDTLNRQFSVIPETLSTSNGTVAPTINNEAGSLLMSPSSALPPEDFMSKLAEELESLGLREKSGIANRRKVASQWLIQSPQNTNLPSEDMDKFPHVSKLWTVVSVLTGGSDFNCCIVNFYADGAVGELL